MFPTKKYQFLSTNGSKLFLSAYYMSFKGRTAQKLGKFLGGGSEFLFQYTVKQEIVTCTQHPQQILVFIGA